MIEDISQIMYDSIDSIPRKTKSIFKQKNMELCSSLDISSTIQLNQTDMQCRICLDNQRSIDNQLIAPCKCTGTVRYVHDKCFKQWIQKQYQQKTKKQQSEFLKKGVECELCKVNLLLIFSYKYNFCNRARFEKCKKNRLSFILFVVFFIINFGCLSFLSYNTSKRPLDFKKQYISSMITILAFCFLSFTGLVTIYYFIFDYLVEKVMVLQGYEQRKPENTRYSRNQVVPQPFQYE